MLETRRGLVVDVRVERSGVESSGVQRGSGLLGNFWRGLADSGRINHGRRLAAEG